MPTRLMNQSDSYYVFRFINDEQVYRVIFSQVADTLIAMAENVATRGKAKSESITTQSTTTSVADISSRTSLRFSMFSIVVAALFGSVTVAHARMVAYKIESNQPITVGMGFKMSLLSMTPMGFITQELTRVAEAQFSLYLVPALIMRLLSVGAAVVAM